MSEIVLSRNQRRAIAALLEHKSIIDAAQACMLSEKTLRRYLAEPSFRAGLIQAEGELLDLATRRLLSLSGMAITTLNDVMVNTDSPALRLRAAQAILDYLIKLRELRDVEKRLFDLEAIIYAANP